MKILIKKRFLTLLLVSILLVVFNHSFTTSAYAATSPSLGTAASYSVLAGSAVTNTGATTISGDVGISPGTTTPNYTGFGTVTLGGSIHDADGAALTAQADKNTAYGALASQGCDTTYAGTKDLAGETLVPGVYCADSFHLTGTLTLNGSASDVWIFKSDSDLILTGGSAVKVLFTSDGQPCNVWWKVVSTATFDANSTLVGNILADTSITFAAGASLNGRALARTAEVTLSSNSITGPSCASSSTPTPTPTPTPSSTPNVSPSPAPNVTLDQNAGQHSSLSLTPLVCQGGNFDANGWLSQNGQPVAGVTIKFVYENEAKFAVTGTDGHAGVAYGFKTNSKVTMQPEKGFPSQSEDVFAPSVICTSNGKVLGSSIGGNTLGATTMAKTGVVEDALVNFVGLIGSGLTVAGSVLTIMKRRLA